MGKERRHGRNDGKRGGRKRAEEGLSEGEEQGRSMGGREIGMEGNFKESTLMRTLACIQYTAHKTTHNAALAIASLLLQIQNYCKRVYKLCIVMCRNVLFYRWMT